MGKYGVIAVTLSYIILFALWYSLGPAGLWIAIPLGILAGLVGALLDGEYE